MWANDQRDGRPAEHRWRPLFNAAKSGWRSLLDCRAVTLPRRETRWNLQGPQTGKLILAASRPKFTISWGHVEDILLLNKFSFRLSIRALVAKIYPVAWQSCAVVPLATFCVLCFQRAACSRFQTCILNSHKGHTTCGSMADIQSAAAEIRRGKNEKEEERRRKNKLQHENIMVCSIP